MFKKLYNRSCFTLFVMTFRQGDNAGFISQCSRTPRQISGWTLRKLAGLLLFVSVNIFQMDISRKCLFYWKYKIINFKRKKTNKLGKKKKWGCSKKLLRRNNSNICAKGRQEVYVQEVGNEVSSPPSTELSLTTQ